MSALTDALRVTVAATLTTYGETMRLVAESAISYADDGTPTIAWVPAESAPTFIGAPFPASGGTVRREAGMETKSSIEVIAGHGVSAQPGNRVYLANGTWKYVNYTEPIGASGEIVAQTIYLKDAAGNL